MYDSFYWRKILRLEKFFSDFYRRPFKIFVGLEKMGKFDRETKLMNGKSNGSCDPDENCSTNSDNAGLKANMGLFDAVMLGVGCIIGSGIFVSTKGVHESKALQ